MEIEMKMEAAGSNQQICRRTARNWRCKNVSGDNRLFYCDKHFKSYIHFHPPNPSLITSNPVHDSDQKPPVLTKKHKEAIDKVMEILKRKMKKVDKETEMKLHRNERLCCMNNGISWRCKNLKMKYVVDDGSIIPDTKYCAQHYFDYLEKREKFSSMMKNGADSSKQKKKATGDDWSGDDDDDDTQTEPDDDDTQNEPDTSDDSQSEPDTSDDSYDPIIAEIGTKRKDLGRTQRSRELWTETRELVVESSKGHSNCSKLKRKTTEDDRSVGETKVQPKATYDTTDCGSIGTKRKKVERTEGPEELESLTREPVVELESLEHYKNKFIELSVQLEKKKLECTELQGALTAGVETRKSAAEDDTGRTPENATEYWKKIFSDLESRVLRMEKENSAIGCVESRIASLESLVLSMDSKILTMKEGVGSRISNLESQNRSIENEKLTKAGCVESRFLKLESLVLKSGTESSIRRCSENKESKAQGVQDDVPQNNKKQRDENNKSKPNAETCSGGGRKDFKVYDFGVSKQKPSESELPKYSVMNISSGSPHLSSAGKNVKEGKGWGCLEERTNQHGSTWRRDHTNMSENACAESRTSNLDSLVLLRSSKQSSLSRGVKLQNCVKIKSEAWDLPKEVTQSGENQRVENYMSKPINITEKAFVNLVSDDDDESSGEFFAKDSDLCVNSKNPVSDDLMEMMAMKYRHQNKEKELQWKFEADMLSSFEEDPELCMKAVCALYRQQLSGDDTSAKGLFHYSDALRGTTLAMFLLDGSCKGDLKRSVKELEMFDSKAVEDCRRLARSYSKQLFNVYLSGKDPYFLPAK